MSYAIIETGGKQFRVAAGEVVQIPSLEAKVGETVEFKQVLIVGDDSGTKLGTPVIAGAVVTGTVVEHGRGDKVIVYKFKRRKQYRRKQGHRQNFTAVRIESVA